MKNNVFKKIGIILSSFALTLGVGIIVSKTSPISTEATATSTTFTKVTDVSQLTAGDYIIIVAAEYNYAMAGQNSSNRGQASVTKTNSTIALSDESTVERFTLETGSTTGTWSFKCSNGYLYASSSSSNQLKTQSSKNGNASWAITVSNGTASIIAQGSNTRKVMQYNQSNSLFACYASASQKGLSLYRSPAATVTSIDFTGSISAYVGDESWDFSNISVTANEGAIPLTTGYTISCAIAVPSLAGSSTADVTVTHTATGVFKTKSTSYTVKAVHTGESADDAFTVEEAIQHINDKDLIDDTTYYTKGIFGKINETWNSQYGNISIDVGDTQSETPSPFIRFYKMTAISEPHFRQGDEIIASCSGSSYKEYYGTKELSNCVLYETSHTVSFNSNGGSGEMTSTTVGSSYKLPNCSFTAPTLKTFSGWKVNNSGNTLSSGDIIYDISSDITLYAQWENLLTVTYNHGADASGDAIVDGYATGSEVTLRTANDVSFTKKGYQISKWNTLADGTGTDYALGEKISSFSANLVLHAIWEEKALEDTYDFTTNFSSYTSDWGSGYGNRTLSGTSNLCGTYSANLNLYYASKQTGTITTMPVFATKTAEGNWTKVLDFNLTDTDYVITGVIVNFVQWGTKTPDVALFDGLQITGTPLDTITIGSGEGQSTMLAATFETTQFSIGYCDKKGSSNVQSGIESIYVELRASEIGTFSTTFNSSGLCDGGVTVPSTSTWGSLATSFSTLSSGDQAILTKTEADESGTNVQQCLAKYDYIIAKYGTTNYSNFMNRTVASSARINPISNITAGSTATIVIIVIAATSLTIIGCYFFYKKRRENI